MLKFFKLVLRVPSCLLRVLPAQSLLPAAGLLVHLPQPLPPGCSNATAHKKS